MSKTKYPNQIDSPSELPIVRDNIFEIGSDAINSLRSAIIQIEKTLGVNPQGAVGLSVGERISQSLDPSGNIRREALDRAGIVSGPIFDDQIADAAAIKEHKLKLNFPTNVLQSQISHVSSIIDEIQFQIEQLSSKLSAHLSPDASGRHPATAISTSAIGAVTSSAGLRSSSASNVQSVLGSIFSSHINYDGSLITEVNNSHSANQIYFDNTNTPEIVSPDVQGAIEDVSNFLQEQTVAHQNLFHSPGSSKASIIYDISDQNYGTIIISSSTSSVTKNLGEKPYFEITLDSPVPTPSEKISIGDMVELIVDSISTEYQIYKIIYDLLEENITGFWLFGTFKENKTNVSTKVFSRRFKQHPSFGIISTARENYGLSSSNLVQVINLDAPYIETSGINPNEISLSNRYFDLKINEVNYSFDVYNSSITTQSIDSIVKNINETVDQLGLPVLAFRVDKENKKSEIVIAHNVSSFDFATASLEVVRVDNTIDSLGLSQYESKVVYGKPGSSYYIGGEKYTGLLKKLDLTGFDIEEGTRNINSGAFGINFLDYGIKKGDVVNIIDSFYNSYEITDITASYISVSSRQLPSGFTSSAVGTARIIIYEATTSVSGSEFLKVGIVSSSSIGSSLFEIFLDKNRGLNSNLILEQEAEIYFDKSIYQIIDYSNPEGIQSATVNFETTDDSCINIWLDDYEEKTKVVGNFNYVNLRSNIGNIECTIFIPDISAAYNYTSSLGGSFSKSLYLSDKINVENNLIISNIHYSNALGKFDGGINGHFFVSKINLGNLDEKDISTKVKNILTETPISELRSSGFISGLKITSVSNPDGYSSGYYLISIDSGICYIEGKRFLVSEIENYNSGIDAAVYDKFYVGIDRHGNFVFSNPDPLCTYPWAEESILLIGTVENSGSEFTIIDQRLFINNLDLKLLNSITVSPHPGMGHFTDLRDAIRYAKRFSEIYPKAGTPEIHLKSGKYLYKITANTTSTYSTWNNNVFNTPGSYNNDKKNYFDEVIRNGIYLDFPVTISGEGDSTEIRLELTVNASDGINEEKIGYLTIIGQGFNPDGNYASVPHDRFNYGTISLNNFRIDYGRIGLIDLLNFSSSTNNYNFKVLIEKLTIDSTKPIYLKEESNTTGIKGNVYISDCKFFGPIIFYPESIGTHTQRYKHIYILNNSFDDGVTSIVSPSGIYTTADYPATNDIVCIGNSLYDTVSSKNRRDRVSHDLLVPGDLRANDIFADSVITDSITASSFEFDAVKRISKIYFANELRDLVASNSFLSWALFPGGFSTLAISSFENFTILGPNDGISWPTVDMTYTSGTVGFQFPIVVEPGQILEKIELGVSSTVANWTIEVYSVLLNGGLAAGGEPYVSAPGIPPGPISYSVSGLEPTRISVAPFSINYFNSSSTESSLLLISIYQDRGSGASRNIFYIKTTIKTDSFNTLAGIY